MALFYLEVNGQMTACFVQQNQKVQNLEDLAVTPDKKKAFVAALSGPSFTHNGLIKIAANLDALPQDARKADKEDYAIAIFNNLVGKKPSSSASASSRDKKKKKKKTSSEDETSSDEERRRAAKTNGKKKPQDEVDELTDAFDRVAIEGQSVSTTPIKVKD